MATDIAKQLIYDLRNDDHVRCHFSIETWDGKATCNTVGCIAGTALIMSGDWKANNNILNALNLRGSFVKKGMRVLGIPFQEAAHDLFIPMSWHYALTMDKVAMRGPEPRKSLGLYYLPTQARPSLETVEGMIRFAAEFDVRTITPDHAAHALEQVTVDEIPYVNWKRAFDEVPA